MRSVTPECARPLFLGSCLAKMVQEKGKIDNQKQEARGSLKDFEIPVESDAKPSTRLHDIAIRFEDAFSERHLILITFFLLRGSIPRI